MPRQTWSDLAIVSAIALVVHGLLLLDTGLYFDDWVVYTYVIKRDWHLLAEMVRDRGIAPVEQHYWWMFRDLPPLAFKAAVFAMIVALGWLATLLGRASTFLSRQESLLVAVVMVCYSGFQTWVLFCTSHYVFFYMLFLLGALLGFAAERAQGWRHWLRRGAALCLLALSYGLNSLLVLTMVFGALLLLHLKKRDGLTIAGMVTIWLPRRLDYFVLPVIYWFAVKWLIPVRGLLEGYNELLMSPREIASGMQQFTTNAITTQLRTGLSLLAQHPLVIVVVLVLGVLFWWQGRRSPEPNPTGTIWLGAIAIVWTASIMFAYAAVGKPAQAVGWNTRHAILISFPLGVTLVAFARLLGRRGAAGVPLAGTITVMVVSAGMAVSTVSTHVALQARAVKDRSVMHQLVAMPLARETSVFWVTDMLPQPWGESYRYYEWAGMFEHAFGDQTRIGLDIQVYRSQDVLITDRPYFIDRYRLKDFDPAGCQANMRVDWGRVHAWGLESPPNPWRLVLMYQRLRLFGGRERLMKFLDEVTKVTLQPLDVPQAGHCARRS